MCFYFDDPRPTVKVYSQSSCLTGYLFLSVDLRPKPPAQQVKLPCCKVPRELPSLSKMPLCSLWIQFRQLFSPIWPGWAKERRVGEEKVYSLMWKRSSHFTYLRQDLTQFITILPWKVPFNPRLEDIQGRGDCRIIKILPAMEVSGILHFQGHFTKIWIDYHSNGKTPSSLPCESLPHRCQIPLPIPGSTDQWKVVSIFEHGQNDELLHCLILNTGKTFWLLGKSYQITQNRKVQPKFA